MYGLKWFKISIFVWFNLVFYIFNYLCNRIFECVSFCFSCNWGFNNEYGLDFSYFLFKGNLEWECKRIFFMVFGFLFRLKILVEMKEERREGCWKDLLLSFFEILFLIFSIIRGDRGFNVFNRKIVFEIVCWNC